MEWGSIVLVVEILLLVAGWLLFQQAKSDLTARAAEAPVLTEIRALEKSVAGLIEQIRLESDQASAQLEARCLQARDLLAELDRRLDQAAQVGPAQRRKGRRADVATAGVNGATDPAAARFADVYNLADEGLDGPAIALRSGLSEGEVELILGLRPRP